MKNSLSGKDTLSDSLKFATQEATKPLKLLTNQPLQTMSSLDLPLKIDPEQVNFTDVQYGTRYVMTVSVRNNTTSAQRIRFSSPKTDFFSINYIPSGVIAPGLDVRAEIECQIPENSIELFFSDRIVVSMGPHKIEVPLLALKPLPNVEFNNFLDFGYIAEGQLARSVVPFENKGLVEAKVKLALKEDSILQLEQSTFTLGPRNSDRRYFGVAVKFTSKRSEVIREVIRVNIAGIPDAMLLDVCAKVVPQKLSLLSKSGNGLLESIDFGTLYFGRKQVVEGYLVNNGPQLINFVSSFPEDAEATAAAEGGGHSKHVTIEPMDGTLNPFSQMLIKFIFNPVLPPPEKGFFSKFLNEYSEPISMGTRILIDAVDTDQKVSVEVAASAVMPTIELSPAILRFGTCPNNDRRDILMNLKNTSPTPLKFEFSTVAQFKFSPSTFTIDSKQSQTIIASFLPTQLGELKKVSKLSLEGGLRVIDIRLLGESIPSDLKRTVVGVTDKLPEDFKPSYKFVDPKEIQTNNKLDPQTSTFKRTAPWESTEFVSSTSWDEVYDSVQSLSQQQLSNDKLTFSIQELQRRANHKETYNDFLKNARVNRTQKQVLIEKRKAKARGLPDRSDPNGVDLGMERDLDDDPRLRIPKATEPLWLANRNESDDRGPHKFQYDEDRLIPRKGKEAPSTQAEMRDCSTELSPDDQRRVQASHKTINFGKVSINSVNVKNFVIVNELQQMVLIKLVSLENEMKQSKPLTQIAVGGSMIGFDIYFTCREVGKYKKTLTYTINDQHVCKVSVIADVVPIEVTLDKEKLILEFHPESLDKSTSQQITMKNPGNSPAEFLWGFQRGYKIIPEQGVISPNQIVTASVVWTPLPEHNSNYTEELTLHITGGSEQTLHVNGILPEAKLAFEDKKLNIGVLAVGKVKRVTAKLKNVGDCPAVFHIDEQAFNVEIKPNCGKVLPGESIELDVAFKPLSPVSYENKVIQVAVRGGRTVNIKLSGEAIIPHVSLAQDSFSFGNVVSGSFRKLPFTLTNTSSIPAELCLDLSEHKDFYPTLNASMLIESAENIPGASVEDSHGSIIELSKDVEMNWKIVVQPQSTMTAYFVFRPKRAKSYNFRLPLLIVGTEKVIAKPVQAEGLQSRLTMSNSHVDFGDRVVSPDETSRMSYYKEVTFTNIDKSKSLTYEVKEIDETAAAAAAKADGDLPTFFISPTKYELGPGQSNIIRITFQPKLSGDYTKVLNIFISGQPDPSTPYLTLLCTGSGVYPKLVFSKQTIVLPTVPLNTTTRSSCIIHNVGYDNLELKYRISPSIPIPLVITFPEGTEVGLTKEKTTMLIATKADSPVAFAGKIEFYDNDGGKFTVDVCGCIDNSLLTYYPFLSLYSDRYGFLGVDDHPIKICTKREIVAIKTQEMKVKSQMRKLKSLDKQASNAGDVTTSKKESLKLVEEAQSLLKNFSIEDEEDGIDLSRTYENLAKVYDGEEGNNDVIFLLKWLNAFICKKKIDITNYPDCVIQSNGDLIIDCIEQLSGKKMSSILSSSNNAPSRNQVSEDDIKINNEQIAPSVIQKMAFTNRTIAKYRALLNFLIKSGALLIHISPVSLLDLESYLLAKLSEFKRNEGNRFTAATLKMRKFEWETEWRMSCISGWNQILLQSFKLFILSRLNFKDYLNTPGVSLPHLAQMVEDKPSNSSPTKKGKKNESKLKVPPEFQASNAFTHSETVLLSWASYHQQMASRLTDASPSNSNTNQRMPNLNRRIVDLAAEYSDFFSFCQIVHSHLPEVTSPGRPLSGYTYVEPEMKEEYFDKLKAQLVQLRLDFDISFAELATSSRAMIILLTHLYLNLPNFISKTQIEFKGKLSDSISKIIELQNPSKKNVVYDVTLEGPDDFKLESNHVVIPPASRKDYKVVCVPKFSKPAKGKLIFWGIREGGVGGMNLVFDLVSKVEDRTPLQIIKHAATLFESQKIELFVTNPFEKECTFPIALSQNHTYTGVDQLIGGQGQGNKTNHFGKKAMGSNQAIAALLSESNSSSNRDAGAANIKTEEEDAKKLFKEPFWCNESVMSIGPKETKKLIVHALPFMLGIYHCQIVFLDTNVGEFCYEIVMNVGLPSPLDELSFECSQLGNGDAIQQVARIASSNSPFEKAVVTAIDTRLPLNKRAKAKLILQSFLTSPITDEDTGQSTFHVDFSSPHFNTSKEFGMVTSSMTGSGAASSRAGGGKKFARVLKCAIEPFNQANIQTNSIAFSFFPERAGVYQNRIVMYSLGNTYDVRVVNLTATVKPSEKKLTLLFKGAARQKILQEIPLHNESTSNWQLQTFLTGAGFSAPKSIEVLSGDKATFTVSFTAIQPGEFDGTLVLKNQSNTQDSFEFKLKGIAEEPLAEDNLKFKCKARSKDACVINIPPLGKINRTYAVETDLPYIAGEPEVHVDSNGGKYEFYVQSPIGGFISGSITFKDKTSSQMVWYTVEIDVTAPVAESVIEVQTEVRKAVAIEITLDNPTHDVLDFDVLIHGDGLIGDNTFSLAPATSKLGNKVYELIYSPLSAGKFVGSISFTNPTVGEFWYKLLLTAKEAEPIILECVECMVGQSKRIDLPVENPLGESVSFMVKTSDSKHFSISQEILALAPYAQTSFPVQFTPSALNEVVNGEILLIHSSLGVLRYVLSGVGLLPGVMPGINILSPVKELGSHTMSFKNPFRHPLPLDIVLSEQMLGDDGPVFDLLLRKNNGIVLPQDGIIQIPVSFGPKRFGDYHATVELRSSIGGLNLLWCFPINGVAEAGIPQRLPRISTPCKSSSLKDIDIALHGLLRKDFEEGEELTLGSFTIEIVVADSQYRGLINRSFRVQPVDIVESHTSSGDMNSVSGSAVDGNTDYAIRYRLLFEPLKVMNTEIELIVAYKNRGRWRVYVDLESSEPAPDDVIRLTAPVGGTDKVSFRLTNRFLGYSSFEAYFSARSSPHFTVTPSSGVLAPYGSEGTQFIITFSPKEYGTRERANLIVMTEEAQWNYEVIGSYPEHNISTMSVRSKINTGIPKK